jgi:hypothetical protein
LKPRKCSVHYTDTDPSGLALMIGGLIGQNLDRDPSRARYLDGSLVAIVASDAEVSVTVRLDPDLVLVTDGVDDRSQVVVQASSDLLLQITSSPLRFGLPDALTKGGREVLGDVLSRRVKIKGLLRNPQRLARFTRLLSVNDGQG